MESKFKFEPMNPPIEFDVPEGWTLRSWYSPSEGAYYISYRTIPERVRGSVIPLFASPTN